MFYNPLYFAIQKMDVNRDGVVTMDEFMQMCSKFYQR
ncbi:unnamed protein product [Ixodes persulcatus]